ncbi:hypothetical protein ACJMK2_037310 [Sinanodonta woodiana]|uniref:Uncharacterized protein n=1 Tax=Sinanodonta woodiana TaxID=1069815 RepID=A0ABD3WP66_SINWO
MMQPVLEMRQKLNTVIVGEEPVAFDVTIFATHQLYANLQQLQPEVKSFTSPLVELIGTSCVSLTDQSPQVMPDDFQVVDGLVSTLGKDGQESSEKFVLIISEAMNHICERCRRYSSESASCPCQRCLSAMATRYS